MGKVGNASPTPFTANFFHPNFPTLLPMIFAIPIIFKHTKCVIITINYVNIKKLYIKITTIAVPLG
jgi:hypothetical protein